MYPIIYCNIDMFAQNAHIYKVDNGVVEDLGDCTVSEAVDMAPQLCYQNNVHNLYFIGETKYITNMIDELKTTSYNNFELNVEVKE